jgi:DNA polymerase elongation subunit (family B)
MAYHDLHRLQFDLETTSLDPARGRVFIVAIRDNPGFEQVLEAPTPEEEAKLINTLCALMRERDPDAIENHNLMGFDLPFLEHRARVRHRSHSYSAERAYPTVWNPTRRRDQPAIIVGDARASVWLVAS